MLTSNHHLDFPEPQTAPPMTTVSEVKKRLAHELHESRFEIKDIDSESVFHHIPGVTNHKIEEYLSTSRHYNTEHRRWISIPTGLDATENALYSPFTVIMQEVLDHFRLELASVEETHSAPLTCLDEHVLVATAEEEDSVEDSSKIDKTSPDICIMGTGSKFRPRDEHTPSYSFCVAPVEIKTESSLKKLGVDEVVLQIAVYARQCFNHQPNRHFACAILATEEHFRIMEFDRRGAVWTGSLDIHKDALAFVRVVLGVASFTNKSLTCFETDLEWLPRKSSTPSQYLRLTLTNYRDVASDDERKLKVPFIVSDKPLTRKAIRGRGMRCWFGVTDDIFRTRVVIKESWREEDRMPEWILLKKVAKLDGVGKMLYYLDSDEESVNAFRAIVFSDTAAQEESSDRNFSRIVLEAYGPPIHYFENPLQLLVALRDAIAGHSHMWKLGILHRDVSIHNIVFGKQNATAGNKGVLIDMDLAIEIKKSKPDSGPRTGTRAFQSVMLLEASTRPAEFCPPHDHLDDLESFFYVLLMICMLFVAPHQMAPRPKSSRLHGMEDPDDNACACNKAVLLQNPEDSLNPWFARNDIFCTLLYDLGTFLHAHLRRKQRSRVQAARRNLPTAFPDIKTVHEEAGTQHHDEFIQYLNTAIEQLESDESTWPNPVEHPYDGLTAPLDIHAAERGPRLGVGMETSHYNNLKRERESNSSADDEPAPKKMHVDEEPAISETVNDVSQLRITDTAEDSV